MNNWSSVCQHLSPGKAGALALPHHPQCPLPKPQAPGEQEHPATTTWRYIRKTTCIAAPCWGCPCWVSYLAGIRCVTSSLEESMVYFWVLINACVVGCSVWTPLARDVDDSILFELNHWVIFTCFLASSGCEGTSSLMQYCKYYPEFEG